MVGVPLVPNFGLALNLHYLGTFIECGYICVTVNNSNINFKKSFGTMSRVKDFCFLSGIYLCQEWPLKIDHSRIGDGIVISLEIVHCFIKFQGFNF